MRKDRPATGPGPVAGRLTAAPAAALERGRTVLKRLFIGATLAGLAVLVVKTAPDIRRYWKIRNM
ncbi:MAG: hypothetical protein JWR24_4972 [Actinoallomurus sp.]|nr:hypothetical protein [Actinoallomurus sp.]